MILKLIDHMKYYSGLFREKVMTPYKFKRRHEPEAND